MLLVFVTIRPTAGRPLTNSTISGAESDEWVSAQSNVDGQETSTEATGTDSLTLRTNGQFSLTFNPKALNADFPNLDLIGRHGQEVAGLADTFSFGLLLTGEQDGMGVYQATTLTIQGDLVYVENAVDVEQPHVYLPLVLATD